MRWQIVICILVLSVLAACAPSPEIKREIQISIKIISWGGEPVSIEPTPSKIVLEEVRLVKEGEYFLGRPALSTFGEHSDYPFGVFKLEKITSSTTATIVFPPDLVMSGEELSYPSKDWREAQLSKNQTCFRTRTFDAGLDICLSIADNPPTPEQIKQTQLRDLYYEKRWKLLLRQNELNAIQDWWSKLTASRVYTSEAIRTVDEATLNDKMAECKQSLDGLKQNTDDFVNFIAQKESELEQVKVKIPEVELQLMNQSYSYWGELCDQIEGTVYYHLYGISLKPEQIVTPTDPNVILLVKLLKEALHEKYGWSLEELDERLYLRGFCNNGICENLDANPTKPFATLDFYFKGCSQGIYFTAYDATLEQNLLPEEALKQNIAEHLMDYTELKSFNNKC